MNKAENTIDLLWSPMRRNIDLKANFLDTKYTIMFLRKQLFYYLSPNMYVSLIYAWSNYLCRMVQKLKQV